MVDFSNDLIVPFVILCCALLLAKIPGSQSGRSSSRGTSRGTSVRTSGTTRRISSTGSSTRRTTGTGSSTGRTTGTGSSTGRTTGTGSSTGRTTGIGSSTGRTTGTGSSTRRTTGTSTRRITDSRIRHIPAPRPIRRTSIHRTTTHRPFWRTTRRTTTSYPYNVSTTTTYSPFWWTQVSTTSSWLSWWTTTTSRPWWMTAGKTTSKSPFSSKNNWHNLGYPQDRIPPVNHGSGYSNYQKTTVTRSSGLSRGATTGIAVGVSLLVILLVAGAIVIAIICKRRRNLPPPKQVVQVHGTPNTTYEDPIHNNGVQPRYQPYQPQPQSAAVQNTNMNISENCAVITPGQVGFENPPPYSPPPPAIGFAALDDNQPAPVWEQTSGLPMNSNSTFSPQAEVHYPAKTVDRNHFTEGLQDSEPPPYPGVHDNALSQNTYVPVNHKSESVV